MHVERRRVLLSSEANTLGEPLNSQYSFMKEGVIARSCILMKQGLAFLLTVHVMIIEKEKIKKVELCVSYLESEVC